MWLSAKAVAAHSKSNALRKSAEAVDHLVVDSPGAFGAGVTPVPIPNTTVKTRCGDDTRKGKVARCRIIQKPSERVVFGV